MLRGDISGMADEKKNAELDRLMLALFRKWPKKRICADAFAEIDAGVLAELICKLNEYASRQKEKAA
jgi:hypothetical protein